MKLTLVFPDGVEFIDLTYYWKHKDIGNIKTVTCFNGKDHEDGAIINCYSDPVHAESEEEYCD